MWKRLAMKGYSVLSKVPALSFSPISWTLIARVLNLFRDTVGVSNTPSWLGKPIHRINVLKFYYHVVPLARISQTLSRHFSLSLIASGRSSELHPVSSHSCCMYVRAGRPAFARRYVGVHRSTSLMSSSLLFLQCSACLVRLTWIVFVMGGRLPYSWCLVGCCRQCLFNIARNILV